MRSSISHFKPAALIAGSCAFLLIAGVLIASEWLIRTRVVRSDPFALSLDLFWRMRGDGVKNAVFGESSVARGMLLDDPQFANLAVGGEHLGLTRAKVMAFFKGRPVGDVILPATAQTLNRREPGDDIRVQFYSEDRKPSIMLAIEHHRQYMFDYWRRLILEGDLVSTVSFLPYGGQVPTWKDNNIPFSQLGEKRRDELALDAYLEYAKFRYRSPEETVAFRIYREIITYILEQGGSVCLLHMPYSPEFLKYARKSEWYMKQAPEIWEAFAASFGPRVRFVNAISMLEDSASFRDATHIQPETGRRIAPQLVERCFADGHKTSQIP